MTRLISYSLVLLMAVPILASAQGYFLPRSKYESLIGNAETVVSVHYGLNLETIGDPELESFHKREFNWKILDHFTSSKDRVYNDIDPTGKEAELIGIETYLTNMGVNYRYKGITVTTSINRNYEIELYEDRETGSYLFTKVVIERTVNGRPDYHDSISRSMLLDVYLQFNLVNGGVVEQPLIYSIVKHEDNTAGLLRVAIEGQSQTFSEPRHPSYTSSQRTPPETSKPTVPDPPAKPTSIEVSPCNIPERTIPDFAKGEEDWVRFYRTHPDYLSLVAKKVTGFVFAGAKILSTGQLSEPTISVSADGITPINAMEKVKETVKTLIMEYSRKGGAWLPAWKDCRGVNGSMNITVQFDGTACQRPSEEPRFSGTEDYGREWEKHLYMSDLYREYVQKHGLNTIGTVSFHLEANGTIRASSIRFAPDGNLSNTDKFVEELVRQVLMQTSDNGLWKAAKKNCVPVEKRIAIERVKFANSVLQGVEAGQTNSISHPPLFDGAVTESESRKKWETYYKENTKFKDFVFAGGYGKVLVKFTVKKDGSVADNPNIQVVEGVENTQQLKTMVEELIRGSQEGHGWSPAVENSVKVDGIVEARVVFQQPNLTPKGRILPKVDTYQSQAKKNEVVNIDSKCDREDRKPMFNACKHHKRLWKQYVSQQPAYVRAVLKDHERGPTDARFNVRSDGSIDANSISANVGSSYRSRSTNVYTCIDEIVKNSEQYGIGWIPGKIDNVETTRQAQVHIDFKKRRVDAQAALNSGYLKEGRQTKKFRHRADWDEWKKEKKGGVHFSFGGIIDLGLIDPSSGSFNYYSQFIGGPEVAFGGMFGNVFGMELRYSAHIGSFSDRVGFGKLGGRLLFNASPTRWPVRFYFPLGADWWHDYAHKSEGGWGLTLGLVCLDVKIGKYGSMYFDLLKGSTRFDKRSNWVGWAYTPSIGFRIARW
ncbi:MAG: hypothetical protein H6603_10220 [Flavobacteriales bacterium]|nr:hypothetical protein [Flavobacteriales bacterium]